MAYCKHKKGDEMIEGILIAVGVYCVVGAGLYVIYTWVDDTPFDGRELLKYVLSWPTILFG